ncbi:Predicted arabinose efflux permease, MFS family [Amycolatopsis tolypomycina]|uniref:Predicted arabinose efflux permease, MFS family n=1 Tax=Amycolatopsis tolypomycina TaxID=208445 RepID=A0A1H4J403_9PSEU|nr:MFS transporter [Amycolatopsis tolypomycina]SEB40358.1 Predicted arabinose efflux permease, MFS family [Amycolatopsis tolypomycina]
MTISAQTATERRGPRELLKDPDFRRLLFTRFAASWGDGVFRAGLAGAVLFNPERGADPLAIAGGFAALLLPYSLVGPFAGALLDRWDRRRVLIVANLLRGLAIACAATAVGFGFGGVGLFSLALAAEGISRFIGSGLSASLPHVVEEESVVTANAFATTLGSVVAVIGGGCAIGLRALFGSNDIGSAETTAFAVLGTLVSAFIARGFAKGVLGPTVVDEPPNPVLAVARGLADGAKHAWRAPSVTAGFVALFAHRASFGVSLLVTVLLMRNYFTDHGIFRAGLPGLGQIAALAGAGLLLAGLLTARLIRRFGRLRAVLGSLLIAAIAQSALGLPMLLPLALLASFLISGAGQVLKLCVDSSIQLDVADEARGRVFALYDTLFNITQVAAVSLGALVVPDDGRSPALLIAATACYLVGGAGYVLARRRTIR